MNVEALTPEKRLDAYTKALNKLKRLKKNEKTDGLCFVLGRAAYGKFCYAPFSSWGDCKRYFIELDGLCSPWYIEDFEEKAETRITYIKNAIEKVKRLIKNKP